MWVLCVIMEKERGVIMILKNGDCVAAVSLSWGGVGDPDIRWRYDAGVDY